MAAVPAVVAVVLLVAAGAGAAELVAGLAPPEEPAERVLSADPAAAAAQARPRILPERPPKDRERTPPRPSDASGRCVRRPSAGVATTATLEQPGRGGYRPVTVASSETSVKWVTVAGTTPKTRVAATVNASAERSENGTAMRPASPNSAAGFSNHMRAAILP